MRRNWCNVAARQETYCFYQSNIRPRNQAFSTYEIELIAIVHAVKQQKSYLQGRHFIMKTDHNSLKYFLHQMANKPFQQKLVSKHLGSDYRYNINQGMTMLLLMHYQGSRKHLCYENQQVILR